MRSVTSWLAPTRSTRNAKQTNSNAERNTLMDFLMGKSRRPSRLPGGRLRPRNRSHLGLVSALVRLLSRSRRGDREHATQDRVGHATVEQGPQVIRRVWRRVKGWVDRRLNWKPIDPVWHPLTPGGI